MIVLLTLASKHFLELIGFNFKEWVFPFAYSQWYKLLSFEAMFDFWKQHQVVREPRRVVKQMTKLGNILLSLTFFAKRILWTKALPWWWDIHFLYVIQNLPNILNFFIIRLMSCGMIFTRTVLFGIKSTFLFCGVDTNVFLGPMDIGVFPCKIWQYVFGSTWKRHIPSLFSSNTCCFVQPSLESSK